MDRAKIEAGVRLVLEGIGEDPGREGLLKTPERVAKMYEEVFAGMVQDPAEHFETTFDEHHEEMVLVKRPQVQERLTSQIADTLIEGLHPQGVIVVLEAEHLCMSMRGVKKPGARTTTSAVRGAFERSQATRAEALSLIFARRS